MKEHTPKNKEAERSEKNRIFYLERDFYSDPQVVIVIAKDIEEATKILNDQLAEEYYPPGEFGELKELSTTTKGLQIISPPGDRHLI